MGAWSGGAEMLARIGFFSSMLFNGKRDLYKVFGYNQTVTFDMRLLKYLRQDIAGRIVDAPASALWTNPPQITSSDTTWTEAWGNLVERHNLFSMLEKLDKLAGIGQYSILVIGYNDGGDLSKPVNTRSITQRGADDAILYLQPYSERSVKIKEYNQDQRSARFMKPEIYTVNPGLENVVGLSSTTKSVGTAAYASFDVHASRVLHIAENTLENGIFGSPRLERVYNLLDDLMKVIGGSSETFWLTANRGMHIDIDKEMEMDPTDAKDLSDEIDEYQHQLRRVIRTRGAKVTNLGSDTPDPTGNFKMLISCLSGATGIPSRILIGSEAGQLASEQDRANWADRIDERRIGWANPAVLFPLIRQLAASGYLPTPDVMEITVEWPSAFRLSPLEFAQASAQHARSATNFAKAIDSMHTLNMGELGSPGQTDEFGKIIPGTEVAGVPGAELGDLITVDEARHFMGLDKPKVTFDSGKDISPKAHSNGVRKGTTIRTRVLR